MATVGSKIALRSEREDAEAARRGASESGPRVAIALGAAPSEGAESKEEPSSAPPDTLNTAPEGPPPTLANPGRRCKKGAAGPVTCAGPARRIRANWRPTSKLTLARARTRTRTRQCSSARPRLELESGRRARQRKGDGDEWTEQPLAYSPYIGCVGRARRRPDAILRTFQSSLCADSERVHVRWQAGMLGGRRADGPRPP